jgi:hypothetical protein
MIKIYLAGEKYIADEIGEAVRHVHESEKVPATINPKFDACLKLLFGVLAYPFYELTETVEWFKMALRADTYKYIDEDGMIDEATSSSVSEASGRRTVFANAMRFKFLIRKYDKVQPPFFEIYESLAEKMATEWIIHSKMRLFYSFVFSFCFLRALFFGATASDILIHVLVFSVALYVVLFSLFFVVVWPLAQYKAKNGDLSREIIDFELGKAK